MLIVSMFSVLSIKSRLNLDPHFLQKLYHLSQVVTLTGAVKFEDSLLIVTKRNVLMKETCTIKQG